MGAVETAARLTRGVSVDGVSVGSYVIPTDRLESDGTFEWQATTMVTVHVRGGGEQGFGYTYGDRATGELIAHTLAPLLHGMEALDIPARRRDLTRALRNSGRPGIGSLALSAVDVALWDLKAKVLGASLATLLGTARNAIPVYGSGGFTSYTEEELTRQLGGWADSGMRFVKMKIGRDARADRARVAAARKAIPDRTELFVDANGAYTRKQALAQAEAFAGDGVTWFEEPVSSDDLEGLRLIRDRAPAGMAISAGEYGYDSVYFRRMLEAGAVDVLQADATRCGGVSGFMEAAALCAAHMVPLSSHCAPALHTALCCNAPSAVHLEYFHDHARIEAMLFDGFRHPAEGMLAPNRARAGLGVELKTADAERFRC